jgi:DnaJ-class molecular chaperone
MQNAADLVGCPDCNGTGKNLMRRAAQQRMPDDPARPGEVDLSFAVPDCPRCGGSGRVSAQSR